MAWPKFRVQYLIYCASIEYADPHHPHRNTVLNGVDYVFGVPRGTEFPFDPEEFWLFARFFSTSDQMGDTKPLWVVCYWLDDPKRPEEEAEVWRRDIGPLTFRRSVIDRNWVFRNPAEGEKTYRFPGPGRYAFKLEHETKKFPGWRVKAKEYISVEVQS